MAKKNEPKADEQLIADAPTIEQLTEFHEIVMEYHAAIAAADQRVTKCKDQLDSLKKSHKAAQADLAAYLNDDELPLLKEADD